MSEYLAFFLSIILIFYLFNYFCVKKNILIDSDIKLAHKSLINQSKVPITGGFLLIIILLFFFKEISIFNKLIFFSIFILGLFSDINRLSSPKIRFYLQLLIVVIFVINNSLYITDIRLQFFNKYILDNLILKILFTCFCLLIIINGSNFIDGVNSLNSGYYFILLLNILILISGDQSTFQVHNIKILLLTLLIFLIFNIFSKSFLGDGGSYVLSFYTGTLLINFFNQNNFISPYYIALLLWYPAFETFFSLFRRLVLEKNKIKIADNLHLHHLLFSYLKKKFKYKKHLNTITGLIINCFNLIIFIISNNFVYNTVALILLIFFSVILYLLIYYSLNTSIRNSILKIKKY